jgi:hypothetical protein
MLALFRKNKYPISTRLLSASRSGRGFALCTNPEPNATRNVVRVHERLSKIATKSPNGRNRAALLGARGACGADSLPFVSRIDRRAPRPARRGARCSRKPRSRSTPPRSQIFPAPLPLARRSARRAGAERGASCPSSVEIHSNRKRGAGHIFKISKLHYPLIYNKRGRLRVRVQRVSLISHTTTVYASVLRQYYVRTT